VDPVGESVLLTETGIGTSRFRGTVALTTAVIPGQVTIASGGILEAEYIDADDGAGGTNVQVGTSALIDCSSPAVLAVVVTDVDHDSAEVTVTTDEPCVVEVSYGTNCAATPITRTSDGLATSSVVALDGLQPGTTYFFVVRAIDEATNQTLVDNGGLCYALSTDDVPLFFTEEFLGDNDMDNVVLALHPMPDTDGYRLCRRTAAGFLTNPTGGTNLALSDDGSAQVNLTGGKSVKLYGSSFTSFHVNANGNLTFVASDGDYTESLSEHFAARRVAALWDDLNPSAGGSVSWKQLSDRVAVTWQNVPEFSLSNQNSFQIELFFTGSIRITCLGIAATDGLTGISRGTGLDPAFVEMNLASAETCDNMPASLPAATPTVVRDF
jgi:hypothetical protein